MKLGFFTRKRVIVLLAAVVLASVLGYFYIQNQNMKANPQEQERSLIEKVGKLILLPQNETPKIATVTNRNQLPDYYFFANAQNGDKVLIYSQAKKAIVYRPSENKIIDVAYPINFGEDNPIETKTSTPSATTQPTVPSLSPTIIPSK